MFPIDDAYEKKVRSCAVLRFLVNLARHYDLTFFSLHLNMDNSQTEAELLQEYKFAVWKIQCRNGFFWFISIERLG